MLEFFVSLLNTKEKLGISWFILFWLSVTLIVGVIGIFMLTCEKVLPTWLVVLYKYGKTLATLSNGERNAYSAGCMKFLMIKKKYFSHFYAIAGIINLIVILSAYLYKLKIRDFVYPTLKFIFGDINYVGLEPYSFSVICLMHITRRYLECVFISVSSDNEINIIHYMTGIVFYLSIALFNANNLYATVHFIKWERLLITSIGFIIFFIGQTIQLWAHYELARLRHDPNSIRSSRFRFVRRGTYYFPDGRLFKYVSCPNYAAEIITYTSLYLLTDFNYNWLALYIWVIVNQIISAILTHRWYQVAFAELYPADRRAIIPFLL
ncbi:polyprenol reductase-like isoform X1 [Panonychus citri]|uniref:polyprenol reductase-like isoform X1 n=1 Tax=Panonychus citri TaxID=50023 RepID=UPI0023079758|nr:polyprenol reductase-like isoform X1 [Panonychus citri]